MQISHIEIIGALKAALEQRGLSADKVHLMPIDPPRPWGVASNACFMLGKQAAADEIARATEGLDKKAAKQKAGELAKAAGEKLAGDIARELNEICGGAGVPARQPLPFIAKVEAEGAYINFYYDIPAVAGHVVASALYGGAGVPARDQSAGTEAHPTDGEADSINRGAADSLPSRAKHGFAPTEYGAGEPTGKRIMVEYAQPNTHKDFHVGHLRNASIGQAIANLQEFAGNDVLKATYIGDVGKHVAKAMATYNILRTDKLEVLLITIEQLFEPIDRSLIPQEYLEFIDKLSKSKFVSIENLDVEEWNYLYVSYNKLIALLEEIESLYPQKQTEWRTSYVNKVSELKLEQSSWLFKWETSDAIVRDEWRKSVDACVVSLSKYFEELQIEFTLIPNCWFFESTVEEQDHLDQQAAAELKALGIAEVDESEEYKGALYVDFEKQADAVRPDGTPVFRDDEKKRIRKLGKMTILRSDGTSLYQTKELGLAKHKFDLVQERFDAPLDESLYVVGAEQKLYFEQVFAILRLWGFPNAERCKHIDYALVVLPEGKMSSREGNIVSYRELRDEAIKRAEEITRSKGIGAAGTGGAVDEEKVKDIAKKIAIAAIKYTMLKVTGTQQIVFDFEEALSFSGRTAPYLQYAYARAGKLIGTNDTKNVGAETSSGSKTSSGAGVPARQIPDGSKFALSAYRHRLPHWRMPEAVYFVTWRLHPAQPQLTEHERASVFDAILHFDNERYQVFAAAVLDDHVHVLVKPLAGHELSDILHSWKSFTAHQLQKDSGMQGSVWQDEYMDRIMRGEEEFWEKVQYILDNPLKRWPELREYEWSYLWLAGRDARPTTIDTGVKLAGGQEQSPAPPLRGGTESAAPQGEGAIPAEVVPAYTLHESEVELARRLSLFPDVCADAAAKYEPATLCNYLYDLADGFSAFYRDCRVLDAEPSERGFRQQLVTAFRNVVRTGFTLLALPLPEEM